MNSEIARLQKLNAKQMSEIESLKELQLKLSIKKDMLKLMLVGPLQKLHDEVSINLNKEVPIKLVAPKPDFELLEMQQKELEESQQSAPVIKKKTVKFEPSEKDNTIEDPDNIEEWGKPMKPVRKNIKGTEIENLGVEMNKK